MRTESRHLTQYINLKELRIIDGLMNAPLKRGKVLRSLVKHNVIHVAPSLCGRLGKRVEESVSNFARA